ncbi:MAG TPA: 3-isopropylmalate dehydratase large subunit [Phycisphaerae bacterium]|nr:3-isopropylmalate dehydratase large subunit [Phycisphaerae bacterium]
MGRNLFQKVWDRHLVRMLPNGKAQLFIGVHLIHEVTSPQAFAMLRERGLEVAYPDRTFATVDHIIPTDTRQRPWQDRRAEEMVVALENNCRECGITFFDVASGSQGIVHIIGPELGISRPGITLACGDSHTSTHGALGAVAFGIGTSQARDILATQTLALDPLKVRRIAVHGRLQPGVYAKDVILQILQTLGVNGGLGYAYEYAGDTVENMSIEQRLTICNMSIEGGARAGYVNPDQTAFDYLKGRPYVPTGDDWDKAVQRWRDVASDPDATYEDEVSFEAAAIPPIVTWGINPGQSVGVDEKIPDPDALPEDKQDSARRALKHMRLAPGTPIKGTKIDVAFVGSCTNGRISDLREVARHIKGRKVARGVKALVVPGSQRVRTQAMDEGLHEVFIDAGFEWREPGCSMCLGMNPDKLVGDQVCASSSNRNFIGRQGSPKGRTLLMSPAMVAAAALHGEVVDVREVFDYDSTG